MFYLDPPHLGTADYGFTFGLEQYTEMAQMAESIQGMMIISINDSAQTRAIFSRLSQQKVNNTYTLGQKPKSSSELIIKNF